MMENSLSHLSSLNANLLYLLISKVTAMYGITYDAWTECEQCVIRKKNYYATFFPETSLVLSLILSEISPKIFPKKFTECTSFPNIFLGTFF